MTWVAVGVAGGSALMAGYSAVAEGNAEEDKLNAYISHLEQSKSKYAEDARKQKMDLMRMNEAGKKQRLTRANQKAAQNGMDTVASSYSNEEDLDNSLYAGVSQIDQNTEQMMKQIDDKIAAAELSMPTESATERAIGGGLSGAGVGLSMVNMLKNPAAGTNTGADQPTQQPVTQPAAVNPVVAPTNPVPNNFGSGIAGLYQSQNTDNGLLGKRNLLEDPLNMSGFADETKGYTLPKKRASSLLFR